MSKQIVIIFGAPGAGKGTQGELLSEKTGAYISETSKIIGQKIAEAKKGSFIEAGGEKYYFEKEREIADSGGLWDPPFVVYFIKEKIKEFAAEGKSMIFLGSPRTVYEAEKLIPVMEESYGKENIKILLLEIKPEQTIFRNSRRKTCELMKHAILFNKETENLNLCPLDGSKLSIRPDDSTPEIVKTRINQYNERTFPIMDYLQKNNYKINKVNGEQSVAEVFADVLKAIG